MKWFLMILYQLKSSRLKMLPCPLRCLKITISEYTKFFLQELFEKPQASDHMLNCKDTRICIETTG